MTDGGSRKMYSHNMVGSNDIDKSKKFYDATFKAMGADEACLYTP